jgi:hypothetical protein
MLGFFLLSCKTILLNICQVLRLLADFSVSSMVSFFFFGKLTYVLKEEDTNIIRGIPQIYNDNINIKQQMATG